MKWIIFAVASSGIVLSVGGLAAQIKPTEPDSESDVYAQAMERKREVLKGLPGVRAKAFWRSPAPSEENDRLQAAVELRLRNNGIHVFASSEEYKNSPGKPELICQVNYSSIGSLVAKIDVQLLEELRSVRTSRVQLLPTWENTLPRDKAVDAVSFEQTREWLLEAVDEFCNAYRAVNPKAAP